MNGCVHPMAELHGSVLQHSSPAPHAVVPHVTEGDESTPALASQA
jgi:hypothetical protein